MKAPEVTIGLPVYNAESFIKDTLNSILNQSFSDFELIILDDGSTDKTLDIINGYNDVRIKLYHDGENKGLPVRLNEITELARGEFIARMDADDIMHKYRIETQIEILRQNTFIDILGTNAYSINEFNEVQGVRRKIQKKSVLIKVDGFIHPSIMGKSSWFVNNPYNPRAIRCEDFELWNRTRSNSNFYSCEMPLIFYREFGGNYYKKYFKTIKGVLNINFDLFKTGQIKLAFKWTFKRTFLQIFKFLYYLIINILGKEGGVIMKRNVKIEDKLLLNKTELELREVIKLP